MNAPLPPPPADGISIVIPSWNGRALLQRYLPSVLHEARRWSTHTGLPSEVIVSDDGSTDDSVTWLQAQPDFSPSASSNLKVIARPVNRGFSPAVNAGVEHARFELLILLNNDLRLLPHALDPVPDWFNDPQLFGVTFRGFDLPPEPGAEARPATAGKLGRFRRGFWETWRNYDPQPAGSAAPQDESSASEPPALPLRPPSFSLVGGFCALRTSRFRALGGFDPLFAPYYWEDIDLSYRARKRGWTTGYERHAMVHHELSSSVKRHASSFRRASVIQRNRLLFHWKNLDPARLPGHLFWAHLLLLQHFFKLDFSYHAGYLRALARLPQVVQRRRAEKPLWRLRDLDLQLGHEQLAFPVRLF